MNGDAPRTLDQAWQAREALLRDGISVELHAQARRRAAILRHAATGAAIARVGAAIRSLASMPARHGTPEVPRRR